MTRVRRVVGPSGPNKKSEQSTGRAGSPWIEVGWIDLTTVCRRERCRNIFVDDKVPLGVQYDSPLKMSRRDRGFLVYTWVSSRWQNYFFPPGTAPCVPAARPAARPSIGWPAESSPRGHSHPNSISLRRYDRKIPLFSKTPNFCSEHTIAPKEAPSIDPAPMTESSMRSSRRSNGSGRSCSLRCRVEGLSINLPNRSPSNSFSASRMDTRSLTAG